MGKTVQVSCNLLIGKGPYKDLRVYTPHCWMTSSICQHIKKRDWFPVTTASLWPLDHYKRRRSSLSALLLFMQNRKCLFSVKSMLKVCSCSIYRLRSQSRPRPAAHPRGFILSWSYLLRSILYQFEWRDHFFGHLTKLAALKLLNLLQCFFPLKFFFFFISGKIFK